MENNFKAYLNDKAQASFANRYSIENEKLSSTIHDLYYFYEFFSLKDIWSYSKDSKRYVCFELFCPESLEEIVLYSEIEKRFNMSDLNLWNSADWFFREIFDLYGIELKKGSKRLLFNDELLKEESYQKIEESRLEHFANYTKENVRSKLVMDAERPIERWYEVTPTDLGIGKSFKFLLNVLDEEIHKVQPEVGYEFKGIERTLEGLNPCVSNILMEQMDHRSLCQWSISHCRAIEGNLGIEISSKAQMLRMLAFELGRVHDHLSSLAQFFFSFNVGRQSKKLIQLKQVCESLFKQLKGDSQTFAIIGGVCSDLPVSWMSQAGDLIVEINKEMEFLKNFYSENRYFIDEMCSGALSPKNAISFGATGPILRSCGINYDIRKNHPYYFYEDMDFEVPIGNHGQIFDLYLVRCEEVIQSLKIIGQLIDNIPQGSFMYFDQSQQLEAVVEDLYNQKRSEELLTYFDQYKTETTNGELSISLIKGETNFFERYRIKSPSFTNVQAASKQMEGIHIKMFEKYLQLASIDSNSCDR